MNLATYRSYRDLPPVAGIASIAVAAKIGFSIDDCVTRLKHHHWTWKRLHEIFMKRLTAEPVYELKMAFSLHAHYCAEHTAAWRQRVGEMREPPLGLDAVPNPALDAFLDEILAAPSTTELLTGIYLHALPALREALARHMRDTNRLVDHPSYRICRFALVEIDEMIDFGRRAVPCLEPVTDKHWPTVLTELLAAGGGLDGTAPRSGLPLTRHYSLNPPAYDSCPRRDERFPDPYNMGVHAEMFLYDESYPALPKTLMMYYKRIREIDVPEMMASIIVETKDKPWDYYADMTRQLWDEARHAMMGEVGFVRAGLDWRKYVRINFTFALALNTKLTPLERHAVLYYIEQGLMPKTGKRFEWETGVASGDPYSAMIQDYDWADEVLHARIGRDWYVKAMGNATKATAFGDQCWAKFAVDWDEYREQGLTKHENWWPAAYTEWCRVHQETPDPRILAYNINYGESRADLQKISSSG